MSAFKNQLEKISYINKSFLCIGLDPYPKYMPIKDIFKFNQSIIDCTHDLVCAYKPNIAFYEALGWDGLNALEKTISYIRTNAPNVPIIGDGKRGDILSTNEAYAKALFEFWGFDATTINPFSGLETITPFLQYPEKCAFVWCRSSNITINDKNHIQSAVINNSNSISHHIVDTILDKTNPTYKNSMNTLGLIVGANHKTLLEYIRSIDQEIPILLPGIGAQKGNLKDAVLAGLGTDLGTLIINSTRSIIYPSLSKENSQKQIRLAATDFNNELNSILLDTMKWDWLSFKQ
ncbi:MAG: orotidine-5'-phosphate decarboxylase [Chloroflexi bacterium]|nr:orotidine-5'-phosphate decarboxylase [Chloroflexota bacterium]